MPRRARLLLQGVPLHIIQRGHNRKSCFLNDADRLTYLNILREHAVAMDCLLHAYVLMTNHVHLLASFDDIALAPDLIRLTAQHYGSYFNRSHKRCGTLWDGRYRSCPVPSERYLLTCQRYIELNPVRAGIVDRPLRYRWSSYRGNAGFVVDALLTPHDVYLWLGRNTVERRAAYRALFEDGLSEQQVRMLRVATNGNHVVGGGTG
jgi:putative transposase